VFAIELHPSHSVPWAEEKRKPKYTYWPGLEADVAQYCKAALAVKVFIKCSLRVPLHPLPVTSTPFERHRYC